MDDLDKVIDDFVSENQMPYSKKVNGIWEIFDGERYVYCGDATKKLIDEAMKKMDKDISLKFITKYANPTRK